MPSESRIYLDHNASTPLAEEASAALKSHLNSDLGGNPSSIHHEGRRARDALERARAQMAALFAGDSTDVVWTGSGTEAVVLGIVGCARAKIASGAPPRILIGEAEHPCVFAAADVLAREGIAVATLPIASSGLVDLDRTRARIAGGAALVALTLANHEVGTIQPIAEVAELSAEVGAAFFCDAVGAAGKLPIVSNELGADAIAVSAHKFYGPRGVGALWLRPGTVIGPACAKGHQERERRPGTENILGAVAAGAAAQRALGSTLADSAASNVCTTLFEAGVTRLGGEVIGESASRVSNTACFRFDGVSAELLVTALDLAGFALSAGAACSSGRHEPSNVLAAMGVDPERALEAVRFSSGRSTTPANVDALLEVLPSILSRIRRFS